MRGTFPLAVLVLSGIACGETLRGSRHHDGVVPPNNSGLTGFHAGAVNASSIDYQALAFPKPYVIDASRCPQRYLYVKCTFDVHKAQQRWYHEEVPKEDRLPMTPAVCYEFCHKIPGTQYFGLENGDRCYCTPYFTQDLGAAAEGRSHSNAKWTKKGHFNGMCDMPCVGAPTDMCGGQDMVSMYVLVNCAGPMATTTTTTTSPGSPCIGEVANISFTLANLVHNNLGGHGPNEGDPAELRYNNVGEWKGTSFDLIVTAMPNYVTTERGVSEYNGIYGEFGQINLAQESTADFTFRLVTRDGAPMEVPGFEVTFVDIDFSTSSYKTEVIGPATGNPMTIVSPDTDMVLEQTDGGVSFRGGFECPKPDSPFNMSVVNCTNEQDQTVAIDQRARSVMYGYEGTSEFDLHVEVQDRQQGTHRRRRRTDYGRNILFAGRSSMETLCSPVLA